MFTSMGLWILSTRGAKSVVSGEAAPKPAADGAGRRPGSQETRSQGSRDGDSGQDAGEGTGNRAR